MDDLQTAEVMELARRLGIRIHVRGTDERPVVEFRDRIQNTVVGGKEIKERMRRYGVTLPKDTS